MTSTYYFADATYLGNVHGFYHYTTTLRDGFAVQDDFGNLVDPSSIYTRTFCLFR